MLQRKQLSNTFKTRITVRCTIHKLYKLKIISVVVSFCPYNKGRNTYLCIQASACDRVDVFLVRLSGVTGSQRCEASWRNRILRVGDYYARKLRSRHRRKKCAKLVSKRRPELCTKNTCRQWILSALYCLAVGNMYRVINWLECLTDTDASNTCSVDACT
jgi:hypothetical protein